MKIRTGESEKMEGERRSGKLVACAAARRNSREGICAGKQSTQPSRQTGKETGEQRDRREKGTPNAREEHKKN